MKRRMHEGSARVRSSGSPSLLDAQNAAIRRLISRARFLARSWCRRHHPRQPPTLGALIGEQAPARPGAHRRGEPG